MGGSRRLRRSMAAAEDRKFRQALKDARPAEPPPTKAPTVPTRGQIGPGSVNAYQCKSCRGYTVTVHRDAGTTPFMLGCRIDGCDGTAVSTMYSATDLEPTHEWYRPGEEEFARLTHAEREHYALGGLTLREIHPTRAKDEPHAR